MGDHALFGGLTIVAIITLANQPLETRCDSHFAPLLINCAKAPLREEYVA
jgi:hypothetical protein